ncbi:ATP-binding cassette subfamily B protein [Hypnocyclicus thermotrophus]|uniref:ATP-binding cassette subfamily B protein n=1 Tax=Hypnocyclicus thermotrophus TaxID=1627895 RepID=A0AA46DZ08_9FUSO|nr:ABC transporter ATP-binding protein [Hypnocyclicus thermotrophus]TDT71453.1 ATP-binding cassette subfamily B protein [Hypnocyclicus thermotrophus]
MDKIKKLIEYTKKYRLFTLLAPLFMMVEVIADLFLPFISKNIINIGIVNNDTAYIFKMGLLMLITTLIGAFGGIMCSVFAAKAAISTSTDLREKLFSKIIKLDFFNLEKLKTGNLITLLTDDISKIQGLILAGTRIVVRAPLLFIGGLIMAIITSKKLSLVLIFIIPIMIFLMYLILKKSFPLFYKIQNKLDIVNKISQENLFGIKTVKSFSREEYEENRFSTANRNFMNNIITSSKIISLQRPLIMMFLNFGVLLIIYFGGKGVISKSENLGTIIAYINYLEIIIFSIVMTSMILINLSRSIVSVDRIEKILQLNEEKYLSTNNNNISGDITFKNIYFAFEDNKYILENISFKIKENETIGIIGVTGSGKSTLVSLIPKFLLPQKGNIYIGNKNINEYSLDILRKNIGFVFQDNIIFSGSIKENITFGNKNLSIEDIKKYAKMSKADEFIENLEKKYDSIIGQRGVNLSGGQKQRLSIARTLANKPKIIIFDDSTSALDAETEKYIMTQINENIKNCTKIIISQKISSVMNADKIIVLDNGKIENIGKHNDLLLNSKLYNEIFNLQIGGDIDVK